MTAAAAAVAIADCEDCVRPEEGRCEEVGDVGAVEPPEEYEVRAAPDAWDDGAYDCVL